MGAYIDSNILIFASTSEEKLGDDCREIVDRIAKGRIRCTTSVLSFDEILYKVRKIKGEVALTVAENLLALPNLSWATANMGTISEALGIVKKHNIAPRDALHAATAIQHKASPFVSDDKDFARIPWVKLVTPREFLAPQKNVRFKY